MMRYPSRVFDIQEKSERRYFPRRPMRLPVLVSQKSPEGRTRLNEGYTENVSAGGCYVLLNKPIEATLETHLFIELPLVLYLSFPPAYCRIEVKVLRIESPSKQGLGEVGVGMEVVGTPRVVTDVNA